MKKVLALMLALVMAVSLASCGGGEEKKDNANTTEATSEGTVLTKDTCIGTWVQNDKLSKDPSSAPMFGQIMDLEKGGVGKGYLDESERKDDSYAPLSWEIKDDCLIVTLQLDSESTAFELDGDNLVTTDGKYTFVKEN